MCQSLHHRRQRSINMTNTSLFILSLLLQLHHHASHAFIDPNEQAELQDEPSSASFFTNSDPLATKEITTEITLKNELYSLADLVHLQQQQSNFDFNGAQEDTISLLEDAITTLSLLTSLSSASTTGVDNVQIDARSGHVASLIMSTPLLPGRGVGNGLLWSVDGGGVDNDEDGNSYLDGSGIILDDVGMLIDEDANNINTNNSDGRYEAPTTNEQWEQFAHQAIQHWITDHQYELQIDPKELFDSSDGYHNFVSGSVKVDGSDTSSSSSTNTASYSSNNNNVEMAIHSNGELIQLILPRKHRSLPVINSQATASIHHGNLVHFGVENWGDIELDVRPSLSVENVWKVLVDHVGIGMSDGIDGVGGIGRMEDVEFWCKPELFVLVRTKDGRVFASAAEEVDGRVEGSNDVFMNFDDRDRQRKRRGLGSSLTSDTANHDADKATTSTSNNTQYGKGYTHHLIYKLCPRFSPAQKYEAHIDAHTGQIYSFTNKIHFLNIEGSVYPTSNDGLEPDGVIQHDYPMLYMDVTVEQHGSGKRRKYVTDHGGGVPLVSDGTVRMELAGPYVSMNDMCGKSELVGSGVSASLDW